MTESRMNQRRKKRRARRWVKWTLGIVGLLVALVLAFGGYVAYQAMTAAKQSYTPIDRPEGKSPLRKQAPTIGQDPISILLEGIENYSTGGKNGRADTLIVVTLNPDTHQMTMVSLNRDWRVMLPADALPSGVSADVPHKINASHSYAAMTGYGANKLTVQTVEKILDIPIDRYVAVDFQGFTDIVDALGGVKIDVKYPFWEESATTSQKIYFDAGPQRMDGEHALAFVRMRKRAIDTKYTRMEREKQFVRATIDQALSAGTIFKIGDISNILGKHVETNLKPKEIYHLEQAYSSMDPSNIRTLKIDGQDKRIPEGSGPYYFVPDDSSLAKVQQQLKVSLGLADPSSVNAADGSSSDGSGSSDESSMDSSSSDSTDSVSSDETTTDSSSTDTNSAG